jgi:hypothetical protein
MRLVLPRWPAESERVGHARYEVRLKRDEAPIAR